MKHRPGSWAWLPVAAALAWMAGQAVAETVAYVPAGFTYEVAFAHGSLADRTCLHAAGGDPLVPLDVDGDGAVTELDALACADSTATSLRFSPDPGADTRFVLVSYRDVPGGAPIAGPPSADDGLALGIPGAPVLVRP